ncbi:hypothetical protein DITRI_Ditri11bG0009000 [Diplodiscus trichospermus]
MKKAKVSSVYEGRGGKRDSEGEGESENSAKRARMSAKARTDGLRARRPLSIISIKRTIVTRSMSTKTTEQKDEEKLPEVEVVEAKEDEKNNKPVEQVKEQPVNEVVVETKGNEGEMLTLADWPLTWSHEEEWSWFKVGYECGWHSYWDAVSDDYWAPVSGHSNELVWDDDLWNFKDNDEIAKP